MGFVSQSLSLLDAFQIVWNLKKKKGIKEKKKEKDNPRALWWPRMCFLEAMLFIQIVQLCRSVGQTTPAASVQDQTLWQALPVCFQRRWRTWEASDLGLGVRQGEDVTGGQVNPELQLQLHRGSLGKSPWCSEFSFLHLSCESTNDTSGVMS